ncbi:MAG TPA: hypothetical protein VLA28_12065, partial [Afifellaceae bacterium]|nr:hypothetical protein [Afifellaceae bacterium]
DLPEAVVLGFDITPRQELAEECYDRDGKLVITPRNVDLCASLPTAAIIAIASEPASNDGNSEPSSNDPAPADDPAPAPDPEPEPDPDPDPEPDPEPDTKNNKGHGNGDEGDQQGKDGSDADNPGKGRK